jgi:CubicO group peptidase (beta-lactamase class C family)
MNTRARPLISVLLFVAWASANAQSGPNHEVDTIFEKWDTPDSPGCAVSVILDGAIVYKRGYGMANLEYGVPITPSSIFHVASVSKHFTAMGVLLLADEGKLTLDDDVRKYVPEVPDFGETITIRHLIHHISGLRDQWSLLHMAGWRWEADVVKQEDVLDITSRQKALNFKPGDEYLYSNTGYTLLAVIIERLSGKTLREFAEERLFEPLGMKDTHFHDDHQMIVPNRAYAYAPEDDGGLIISIPDFDVVGATSLFTTVEDLARWDRNFYTGRVGGHGVIEQMSIRGRLNDGKEIPYAVGLSHGFYRGLRTVSHGGSDAGYRSHFIRFPHQRFSLAVLCNFPSSGPGELARKIADIYLAEDFTEPVEQFSPIELPVGDLERLAGLYRHPASDTVWSIEMKDSVLVVGGERPRVLQPLGKGRFRVEDSSTVVTLETGPSGSAVLHVPSSRGRYIAYQRVERAHPNPTELEVYVGPYYSVELGAEYAFRIKEDKLVLWNRKIGEKELEPSFEDGFTYDGYAMAFTRDTKNRVDGFTLSSGRVRRVRFEKKFSS